MSNKKTEIIAGVVAGFVAIPQCVALGVTAFAPFHGEYSALAQVTGFVSAIVAGFFVAVFGRGQISLTGPRIGATIVIAGTLASFLQPASGVSLPHEIALGLILIVMMLAGVIQAILGHAQLASLHNYIARPVIVGLLCGVAVTMLLKQIRLMLTVGLGFSVVALLTAGLAGGIWWLGKYSTRRFWSRDWVVRLGVPIAAAFGVGLYFLLQPTVPSMGGTLEAINQLWMWPNVGPSLMAAFATLSGQLGMLWSVISAALMLAIVASIDTTTAYINTKKKLRGPKLSPAESFVISRDDENNELKWHGIGNFVAGFFGGMTSSASDARASAAVGVGGRTWIAGLVYVLFIAVLLGSSPHVPWTDFFPQAVVSGLMLQIAAVLLNEQKSDLKRYFAAIHEAAKSLIKTGNDRDVVRNRRKFFETALNGVSVFAVALSLNWFDPLQAVSLGMLCSMSIFLFKIGQSQRHHCYLATERSSLETRSLAARRAAEKARSHCHIIKLQGDYFFLSQKKANNLYGKVIQQSELVSASAERINQFVVIDFDMAHEFDESGVGEIKALIEKLQAGGFVVLLSYLNAKSDLLQLMSEDGVVSPERRQSEDGFASTERRQSEDGVVSTERRQRGLGNVLIGSKHVFANTERAINYVEDEYVRAAVQGDSKNEVEPPFQLRPIFDLPLVAGDAIGKSDVPAKFWIVCKGKVTLRLHVHQSVADSVWRKVVAEVGPYGVISDRAIQPSDLTILIEPGTELRPITESFIEALKMTQPLQAAELLEYLLEYLVNTNEVLQREALMLDH